jgi:hypothetical protein
MGAYKCYYIHITDILSDIGLVICNGPPGQTKGGRFGLIPQIKASLKQGAVILMDDTIRDDERSIIEKYKSIIKFDIVEKGEHDLHTILTVN